MSTYKLKVENKKKFDLESLCRQCGKCCAVKKVVDGKLIFTEQYCPHLQEWGDGSKKTFCDIYDKRSGTSFQMDGKTYLCESAKDAFKKGFLPNDCPYFIYYYCHPELLGVMSEEELKKRMWNAFALKQYACEKQDWSRVIPGPKANCPHCYGRGYEGRDVKKEIYVLCRCVNR